MKGVSPLVWQHGNLGVAPYEGARNQLSKAYGTGRCGGVQKGIGPNWLSPSWNAYRAFIATLMDSGVEFVASPCCLPISAGPANHTTGGPTLIR